jgi:hypothetical protein
LDIHPPIRLRELKLATLSCILLKSSFFNPTREEIVMKATPSSRFTRLTITAGILITFAVALAAPVPADAAGCIGCKLELVCGAGATCWIFEYCDEDAMVIYNICGVDQFGNCTGFGDPCFRVDADPAGWGPLGPIESSIAESCQVAVTPVVRSILEI